MILTNWRLLRNLVPSRLAVAPTTRRRRLQNPGHVAAAIQDGSEQRLVALRHRDVMAVVIERAEVHLAEATADAVEQFVGRVHRRIDRVGVRDVQTETGVRQSCEERFQLGGNAAAVLAEVHVLEREPAPEGPTRVEVDLGVGMHHDRAHPGRKLVEERVPAERVDPLDRGVDAYVAEREPRLGAQIGHEAGQLVARQRRQLDGDRRDPRCLIDKAGPRTSR
jgi:hypothetical protein